MKFASKKINKLSSNSAKIWEVANFCKFSVALLENKCHSWASSTHFRVTISVYIDTSAKIWEVANFCKFSHHLLCPVCLKINVILGLFYPSICLSSWLLERFGKLPTSANSLTYVPFADVTPASFSIVTLINSAKIWKLPTSANSTHLSSNRFDWKCQLLGLFCPIFHLNLGSFYVSWELCICVPILRVQFVCSHWGTYCFHGWMRILYFSSDRVYSITVWCLTSNWWRQSHEK